MKKNSTAVVLLIDESGSMRKLRNDTIGSVNMFISEQAGLPGDCHIKIVTFDSDAMTIRSGPARRIEEITERDYAPSGMTALYDALKSEIKILGEALQETPESERPDRVVFAIITDGEDTASVSTRHEIRDMIMHQESVYSWQFLYLAAGFDAFSQAAKMGIQPGYSAQYAASSGGYRAAMGIMSASIADSRSGSPRAFTTSEVDSLFPTGKA